MKIYLDLLFFLNFTFDFILLTSVKIILKRNIKLYKVIFGALIGALSIFLLFLRMNSFTLFLFKLLTSIMMILITFSYKDIKYTIKNFLFLYFNSFILGGFLYFLNNQFSYRNTGLIFFHKGIGINVFVLIIISPLVLYSYIKEYKKSKINTKNVYAVDIWIDKEIFHLTGYLDTGNKLYDPYLNRPIMILVNNKIKMNMKKKIYVPYETIANKGLLECGSVDKIIINGKVYHNILIGYSPQKTTLEGIDLILHSDFRKDELND